jgi:hypothetical protein
MHAVESPHQPPGPAGHLEENNRRLELLVGELLKANQELRFKVALLEKPAAEPGRGPLSHSL